MKFIIRFFIVVALIIGAYCLLTYGTLSPCGMLKKEIFNQAKKYNMEAGLTLFGDFFNAYIDNLSPAVCIKQILIIKLGSGSEEEMTNQLFGK
jgi:hypothetical protein